MANIEVSMTTMFSRALLERARQKTARLRGAVETESITSAEDAYFEAIGDIEPRERSSLLESVNLQELEHTRRKVIPTTWENATVVADEAKARMLIDVQSDYTKKVAEGLGRQMDRIIVKAMLGDALTGKTGSTIVRMDPKMVIAKTIGPGGGNKGLNLQKLIEAKKLLDQREVPDGDRFLYTPAAQLHSLLQQTEPTSSDFNTVKTLVAGDIDSFYGFKFIRGEQARRALQGVQIIGPAGSPVEASTIIGTVDTPTDDAVLFFQKSGVKLGILRDLSTEVERRADILAEQIVSTMDLGASRVLETHVGYMVCDANATPEGS